MAKKQKKSKKPRLAPVNSQLPLSKVRKVDLRGPLYYLQHAREYPIFGCWIYADWKESGITPVIVAREQENGNLIFCACMVDIYCLGIKDCYARAEVSRSHFERELPAMCTHQPEPCSVEFAHELIYGAMDYAQKYGFEPSPEFTEQLANLVLDPPDTHPRAGNIEFGKDGKPLYVSGPFDDEPTIQYIIETLTKTAGEGNFNYLVGLGGEDFDDEWAEDDFDDEEELEDKESGAIIINAEAEDTKAGDEEKPDEGQK